MRILKVLSIIAGIISWIISNYLMYPTGAFTPMKVYLIALTTALSVILTFVVPMGMALQSVLTLNEMGFRVRMRGIFEWEAGTDDTGFLAQRSPEALLLLFRVITSAPRQEPSEKAAE